MYVKGKGVRYRARTGGVKLLEDFSFILELMQDKGDFLKLKDFLLLCINNYWKCQTLTVRSTVGGRDYGRPMALKDVAKIIGKSTRSATELIKWCREKDLLRRGTDGVLVVNPDLVQLGNRVSAIEYFCYKDRLKDTVGAKYIRLLEEEYSNIIGGVENEYEGEES